MKVTIRRGIMFIKLPVINPSRKSKTGKSLLVATSRGPRRTALRYEKKPLIVNVNAYVRSESYLRNARPHKQRSVRRNRRARRNNRSKKGVPMK
jgi:hypothetical protein